MDDLTKIASEAIVRGAGNDPATVANIVRELHAAAVTAHDTLGREEAVQVMILANAIEIDAELAAAR